MKQIKITGENTLTGEIKISGAKNSAVALIPAAILCDEQATIFNVPNISDIDALSEILEYLGAGVKRNEDAIIIDVRTKEEYNEYHMKDAINIPYENIVETLEKDNKIKD